MEVLYLLDIFQKSRYQGQIHLILPASFEKTIQGTLQNEILSNLSKVRTMAVYDTYKLAVKNMGRMFEKFGCDEVFGRSAITELLD